MYLLNRTISIGFLILLLLLLQQLAAQSYLSLDAAQVFSTFKFSSNNINTSSLPASGYSTITTTAFGCGYKYADSNGLMITAGLGIRKAGSSLVLNRVSYTWNLQYIDIKAGIGYQYSKWRLKPYVSVSPFYSQLLNARQTIGINYYDIKTGNIIKTNDFGLFLTAGFSAPLSKLISIYLDYNYIWALRNLETTQSQYLYNRASAFRLGVLLNFSAAKAKETPNIIVKNDTTILPLKTDTQIVKSNTSNQNKTIETHTSVKNQDTAKNTKNDIILKSDTLKTTGINNKETVKIDTLKPKNIQKEPLIVENEQQDKLDEKQLKNISQIANNQNITFKIQLVAVKNELKPNNSSLKNIVLPVKKEKGDDGWFRYYTGSFKTYEKALTELNKIKSNGINTDAFIVAFKDGKKITTADAKNIVK